ncbi:hypothetical protein I9H08_00575 [Pseudomonas syringae pv. syringae]|uniref:hypothetical protein n=2 Tax=Pseudomonas TaxID=286 RepID=UPI000CD27A3C|nr:hypothetical protein [Pseudomonas syringae]POD21213.1 hypothetical protein BKM12_07230 [Pseudomonas syringae pv. syringae]UQB20402.1 hypothetical protein I9H08_00575 [Pseudomonas syringae pv. syringae]
MSNDKKPRIRNRDKRFTLRVSQEEKDTLQAAMAATGSNSVADLVMNSVNNANVILINEVESYNDVFAKAGGLGKNLIKGLNLIQSQPEKFKTFINYLEKDNGKNLAAMMAFASNLEKAVNTFCLYEDNIKCSAELTLKEFVKSKKKKRAKNDQ